MKIEFFLSSDEIRAEHVKLSWDPPQDDGGTPITSYLVRYMDIDSGEWVTACTVSFLSTVIMLKVLFNYLWYAQYSFKDINQAKYLTQI